ncbi:hypothetical protein [Fusobacterium polymorphum]|jgi:hypothetical protein|uniref:Uncharacterized protein n=1 Tax=Fusobacterium nucleatum subsp. polymorphum TaxID=76857 RepID=A0A2C6BSI0_FUSNP|nr:hypothetical protein [Fusobacterium polymorphum]PHI07074.1 hypothetical protein CBG54_08570 [Fusobacterium polymorphum]
MQDLYFKNEEARIIFGLAELGGKQQMDFLGIDYGHYSNKKLAEKWYSETKEIMANSKHPKLEIAFENLEKLYKGMIRK